MQRNVYFAREIADALGMTVDHFYRIEPTLRARGLPPSMTAGRKRYPKAAADAFLAGYGASPRPANDLAPMQPPASDDAHRALLARAYGA